MLREKFAPIPDGHTPGDKKQAMLLALEQRFFAGIYFQEKRPTWDEAVRATLAEDG